MNLDCSHSLFHHDSNSISTSPPIPVSSYNIQQTSNPSTQTPNLPLLPRRSQRPDHPPAYLADFHCNFVVSHWCNIVTHSTLATIHTQTSDIHSKHIEPSSYKDVVQNPLWVEAMNKELQALAQNNTWTITTLPIVQKTHRL